MLPGIRGGEEVVALKTSPMHTTQISEFQYKVGEEGIRQGLPNGGNDGGPSLQLQCKELIDYARYEPYLSITHPQLDPGDPCTHQGVKG